MGVLKHFKNSCSIPIHINVYIFILYTVCTLYKVYEAVEVWESVETLQEKENRYSYKDETQPPISPQQ